MQKYFTDVSNCIFTNKKEYISVLYILGIFSLRYFCTYLLWIFLQKNWTSFSLFSSWSSMNLKNKWKLCEWMVGVKVAEFCVYSRDDGGLTSVLDSLPKMTGHKSFMMMMVVMVRMTMMMTMMIMILTLWWFLCQRTSWAPPPSSARSSGACRKARTRIWGKEAPTEKKNCFFLFQMEIAMISIMMIITSHWTGYMKLEKRMIILKSTFLLTVTKLTW